MHKNHGGNHTFGIVLAAMARAHELVLGFVPWHNAAQMSANSIERIIFQLVVIGNNKVSGITLQSLDQRPEEVNKKKKIHTFLVKVQLDLTVGSK